MIITLYGQPITKKNHMQIITCAGRPRLIQSKKYREYEKDCLSQLIKTETLKTQLHIKCLYWLETARKTDLTNLLAATHDILQKAEIIEDDALIKSVDGSRIMGKDKYTPRVEIFIEEFNADNE